MPGLIWGRGPRLVATVGILFGAIDGRRSALSRVLRSLVVVRVSQINSCAFCIDINFHSLANRSGSMDKRLQLTQWRQVGIFDEVERAVLGYAETMTFSDRKVTDDHVVTLRRFFDDDGVVELTGLFAFRICRASSTAHSTSNRMASVHCPRLPRRLDSLNQGAERRRYEGLPCARHSGRSCGRRPSGSPAAPGQPPCGGLIGLRMRFVDADHFAGNDNFPSEPVPARNVHHQGSGQHGQGHYRQGLAQLLHGLWEVRSGVQFMPSSKNRASLGFVQAIQAELDQAFVQGCPVHVIHVEARTHLADDFLHRPAAPVVDYRVQVGLQAPCSRGVGHRRTRPECQSRTVPPVSNASALNFIGRSLCCEPISAQPDAERFSYGRAFPRSPCSPAGCGVQETRTVPVYTQPGSRAVERSRGFGARQLASALWSAYPVESLKETFMAVEKLVLLALPHAFIVGEMRPLLVDAGYAPIRLDTLDQLANELGRPLQGAVISIALTSSVNADAATVFQLIRERAPKMSIVFAGMADFETMKGIFARSIKALVAAPVVKGPQPFRAAGARNRALNFLVLRKEDLPAGASYEAAL